MSTTMYLHHHGDFNNGPDIRYVGGRVEVMEQFDTDLLSFRDLEEFAEKYSYSPNSVVYFQKDGKSLSSGIRVVYNDETMREVIELHKPFGKIELFVDHFSLNELFDVPTDPITIVDEVQKGHVEKANADEEHSDENDPDFESDIETDYSDSEGVSLDPEDAESDDELDRVRQSQQQQQKGLETAMKLANANNSDESEFGSDKFNSDDSSSEDENHQIGYVGPPNPRKRKGRTSRKTGSSDIKWESGQKFVNMEEFRALVRQYGIIERRGVQFVTNDSRRCQVCCEADCPFYMWCSRDKDSMNCTLKALTNVHNCTKPYNNKMASVKELCDKYGDRLRKNPQWTVKEMAEVIKAELEIEVPRIKIIRKKEDDCERCDIGLSLYMSNQ